MSFATITTEQLDFLYPSRSDSRLETILRTTRDPMTGEFKDGFESIDACSIEDQNRACALRGLPRKLWPNIPSCDPQRLAGLLETIIDVRRSKPAPSCLASATYVRSRRIGVLGSILDLVRNSPEPDIAWLTAGDYNSRFDPKASWPSAIPGARMRFEHQLERSGALTAPGFLIAYLHGYFLPDVKAFQLQYRGIVGGQKLKCIREWGKLRRNGEVAPSQIKIAIHVVRDLVQQISGMMHNFLPAIERTATGDISSFKRMTEPYDSVYLIWLSQHSLADMLILNGAFYLDGRLVLAECCNAVASRPISRSPHVSPPSIRPGRQRGRKLQSVPGSRILPGV